MIRGLTAPGAPTPPDTSDKIFISPDTAVSRDAFTDSSGPVPMTVQQPTPQAVPVVVGEAARILARVDPMPQPLLYKEIGPLRYALLDVEGITSPAAVRLGTHDEALTRLIPEIARGALELARATIDRLSADTFSSPRPVLLHSDLADVRRIVGQTLFWADHYLTTDSIAAAAAAGRDDITAYKRAVAELLELRPLVEAGIVVPVFLDLALALIETDVDKMVAADLADRNYVAWAEQQIVVEGPTAREAAFVHVVDDYPHGAWFYLPSRIDPSTTDPTNTEGPHFRSRLLNRYDPNDDYGPWLVTVRRQAVAQLTKMLDIDLAVATAFGADLITGSPFRARALRRRPTTRVARDYDVTGAVWADVPWLPDAPADLLVKIASSEPRVEELRRATATALRTVEDGDVVQSARAFTEVADDLTATAAKLGNDLRQRGALDLALPTGLATGSVLLAGTLAPPLAVGAALAGAAAALPAMRAQRAVHRSAAYAFWMARPR